MTLKVRPISKFAEIDTRKFYALYTDMTPAAAAEKYQARYGETPAEVLTYGEWLYIERKGPQAWLVKRR